MKTKKFDYFPPYVKQRFSNFGSCVVHLNITIPAECDESFQTAMDKIWEKLIKDLDSDRAVEDVMYIIGRWIPNDREKQAQFLNILFKEQLGSNEITEILKYIERVSEVEV